MSNGGNKKTEPLLHLGGSVQETRKTPSFILFFSKNDLKGDNIMKNTNHKKTKRLCDASKHSSLLKEY